eukprot:COSAG01_NODE_3434_length_6100_cov_7.180970_1_plen_50_part_10
MICDLCKQYDSVVTLHGSARAFPLCANAIDPRARGLARGSHDHGFTLFHT